MTLKTPKFLANWNDLFSLYNNKHNIEKATFLSILKTFNSSLASELIEGKIFKLPYMGVLGITKSLSYKPNNYVLYDELNKTIKEKNYHSEGYLARFTYRLKGRLSTKTVWRFRPSRSVARTLAKKIKTENYIHKYIDKNENYLY